MEKKEYQKGYHQAYKDKRKRVSLSLNDASFSSLEYLAKQENVKITTYAKELLENSLNKQNPNKSLAIQEELRQIKLLIRNIATNVNQIAHRSNTLKVMVEEQELLSHLQNLEKVIITYVEKKTQ